MTAKQEHILSSARRLLLAFVLAQAAVSPAPAADPPPPPSPDGVAAPTDDASREVLNKPSPKIGMVRWGPFEIVPRASASVRYDDNINIQPVARLSDLIWDVTPAVSVVAGDPGVEVPVGSTYGTLRQLPFQPYNGLNARPAKLFLLDYAPTFEVFTDNDQYNAVNQAVKASGIYGLSRLTLGLNQDYLHLSDTIADVGNRTTSDTFTTQINSKYDLSDRTCLQINGEYKNIGYEDPRFTGSRQWLNQNYINRQLSSKVNAGLGLAFGYWDVDRSPSQTFEQLQARAIYRAAEKLDVTLSAGAEYRQYEGDAPSTLNPVFSLAGTYRPRDSTSITLEAHELQQSSAAYGNQNYSLIGFSLSLRQRVFQKWYPFLRASYDLADYHATQAGVAASRRDSLYSIRLGLDYQFSERWQTTTYYQYQRDDSNQPGSDYDVNQVGLQASWRF